MKNNVRTKVKYVFAALLLCLLSVFGGWGYSPTYAADTDVKFDETNVLDDLKSAAGFDETKYYFDPTADKPEILNMAEYCYSYKKNMQRNWGLYLYVYNPQGVNFDTVQGANKVQIATAYTSDTVNGETIATPSDYEKFGLKFCSKSEESGKKGLFYKFKVVDRESSYGKTILSRVNDDVATQLKTGVSVDECERRYDLSGIELLPYKDNVATEYTIGGTFTFKGYAKGYGNADEKNTLRSDVNELETVRLDVINTHFRTGVSSAGKDHQNDLNSVYFAVDNDLLTKYGKLQKIKAEWYEYKTTPVVLSSDKALIDALLPFMGKDIGDKTDALAYSVYYNWRTISNDLGNRWHAVDWAYNLADNDPKWYQFWESSLTVTEHVPRLNYALLTDSKLFCSNETFANYVYTYNASFDSGTLPIKHKTISADLFLDGGRTVDSGRTAGYNCKEFDTDDKFDMLSYDSNHSAWQRFWAYFGQWGTQTDGDYYGLSPIYKVTAEDLTGAASEISARLCVNEGDIEDSGTAGNVGYRQGLKTYYSKAVKPSVDYPNGQTVFLFRYAQTDYYSKALAYKGPTSANENDRKAYLAQQSVFLDFDILTLTFNKEGVYKVIPAVSSPIDVFNGFTPPLGDNGNDSWWKWVLMVLALILVVILLAPVLPVIIGVVVWLVLLPFKAIAAIVKAIGNAVKKRKEKKE